MNSIAGYVFTSCCCELDVRIILYNKMLIDDLFLLSWHAVHH